MRKLFFFSLALLLFPLSAVGWQTADDVPPYRVETVIREAFFPVALAFAPDGRLFYTEKEVGRLRVINTDGTHPDGLIDLDVDFNVELGMLGVAIDPNFEDNNHIWIVYIQPNTVEPPTAVWKLIRLEVDEDNIASNITEMLSVPITTREQHHVGGNVHFDADGFIYVSIGDMGNPDFAQSLDAMQGRIHRFEVDGDTLRPAPDNPFDDNSTFAYGLRNPFDFTFDSYTGDLLATENGPTCDDEINLLLPGGNYGWRSGYSCDGTGAEGYLFPIRAFTPTEGLTGIMVYDGEMFPEWQAQVFFCGWNQRLMRRMTLDDSRSFPESITEVRLNGASCTTDLAVAPDGSIYFTDFGSIYRIVRDEG